MEQQLAKVVNRGYAGEPQHICLQILETNKIFEFSQIKYVIENEETKEISLIDNNLDQNEINRILNGDHTVNITFDENDNVTLYF
jgi:hypothetical protein